MKVSKAISLLFLIVYTASAACAQQTLTQTATAQNKGCNNHCTLIDTPGLNNNAAALIFVTQAMGNGTSPIGAYYRPYEQKWSIYNLNNAVMPVGAAFDVEYYAGPDANHFVYIVPQLVHTTDDAYIDQAGLNGNPNAGVRIFPTNPTAGNAAFNQYGAHAVYVASAAKWAVVNDTSATMPSGVAYNVMFSGG